MATKLHPLLITIIGAFIAAGAVDSRAAKAPLDAGELTREARHVVSGKVLEVTSKTQKSTVERAKGIHRDRVFTVMVRVTKVSKGSGVKEGDEITVVAWQPSTRIPPLPGLQGHESIPEKGDTATFYLKGKAGAAFEPLLPNGIVVEKGAE